MRVVLDGRCIQDHFPGIARYAFNLARSLGQAVADPDEIVVLVDPNAPNRRYDLRALSQSSRLRLCPIAAPIFHPLAMGHVFHALRQLQADVYHSPYYIRPPFAPCPSVVTIFDLIAERQSVTWPGAVTAFATGRLIHLAIALAIRRSTKVLVPSKKTAQDVRSEHGIDSAKLALVPLGVDSGFSPADPFTISIVRNRYNLPSRFVLTLGINKPHKNLARLIQAYRSVDPNGVTALVLAGREDPRYPSGADLAQRAGIPQRVRVLGDIPAGDLAALYSAADLFVFPSLDEGFGLPPLEAMACGTPVACSGASSLPEVVGDAAELFDPTDEAAISAAIESLLGDERRRDERRAAGLARAREFSWRRAADRTAEVYRAVGDTR